ncbi:MAG: LysR family transcriptional regulator [Desulfovibrio sp.]|jgi:DNA-binding transcriptional LysR family regulator|nr:LysR family transcriptional regulator [Desulfovibrio sp.]
MLDKHSLTRYHNQEARGEKAMELRALRYFLAIANEESISGAAAYLNLTQPTLSRQLLDLEEELGVKLMIRGGRKVTLTEKGRLFRNRALEIVELADRTAQEFAASDEGVSGEIHIGGGETEAMRLIAGAAADFRKMHPQVRYHLFSGNAEDVIERLDKGLLNFGVLLGPTNLENYESLRLPIVDTWGILMRKDSPLASLEAVRPEDLRDAPIIGPRQRLITGELAEWIGRDFGKLNIVATYNLIFNVTIMVDEGIGYAFCLDKLVNTANSNRCFKPLEPFIESYWDIVWKKYQVFSKPVEKLLSFLREKVTSANNA